MDSLCLWSISLLVNAGRGSPHAQLRQQRRIPAIRAWGFTDHHRPAQTDLSGRNREGELRGPKSASNHCIKPIRGCEPGHVGTDDRAAVGPAQTPYDPFEEICPLGSTIEQRHMQMGKIMSDHQARHTATRAQIEHSSDLVVVGEGPNEPTSMGDDIGDRTCTKKSETLRVLERRDQFRGGRAAHRNAIRWGRR